MSNGEGHALIGWNGRYVTWTRACAAMMITRIVSRIGRVVLRKKPFRGCRIGMIGTCIFARQAALDHREEDEEHADDDMESAADHGVEAAKLGKRRRRRKRRP